MGDHGTIEAGRTSWVAVDRDSDFPLQNQPYGVFSRPGHQPRVGAAIGDRVVDLGLLAEEGLLDGVIPQPGEVLEASSLNPLLARGRSQWRALRGRLTDLLADGDTELAGTRLADTALPTRTAVDLHLPFDPGDYVDFYSSLEHATNLGRMFRPDDDPLLDNWRHLPVAYHGRASTVVVSGTPITRPVGQLAPAEPGGQPRFGPSERLDVELEVGFVTGPGNLMGRPIPADEAEEHIFGFVLVNDWSARDIQAWEYRPLGPFLGKSFATSVSPWVVPLDALAPFRVAQPVQEPPPLDYLRTASDWGLDIDLEVDLQPAGARAATTISRTGFAGMYWTPAQQLAHVTAGGTAVRPGDLYASGTVSGSEPGTYGSLIELTRNGADPITLDDGTTRTFLEDGDTVIMRGWCRRPDRPRIGFGEVTGTVKRATSPRAS